MIFARALGNVLRRCLEEDPRVVLLGEDIKDPYGGAFKVIRGLSTDYPNRVRTTPVSEAGITGLAAGLALAGFRPIVEIMFGDFLSLCFDQMLNHITKFQAMYNQQVACPVILRTPSGGGRAYGPTHSQSLEKHFMGIPHLRIVAASLHHDPLAVFRNFLETETPALYIEHKLLYPRHLASPEGGRDGECMICSDSSGTCLPSLRLSVVPREDCTVTVLAYGYQAVVVKGIIEKLALEEEVFAELLLPAQIAPMDWGPVQRSVEDTGSLVTVEEGTGGWSWGSEIAAEVNSRLFGRLRHPVSVIASDPTIIPSAQQLEEKMLVNPSQIESAIRVAAA